MHYIAPEAKRLGPEMDRFVRWFNTDNSMEPVIKSKKGYYAVLESTQKGSLDVSQWLIWYLDRLYEALGATNDTLSKVLVKAKFWETHQTTRLNERQVKMINILLGDFIEKGILSASDEGGRSTNYNLNLPD